MAVKSTGVIRQTDHLGRIVLPKSLRDKLMIGSGTALEIAVQGDKIVLQKYEPGCKMCGTITDELHGPSLCRRCISVLHKQVTDGKDEQ